MRQYHPLTIDHLEKPVYAETTAGCQLVLTAWMLLDRLTTCQESAAVLLQEILASGAGEERRLGTVINPLAERTEALHFEIGHLLRLLWRSGLWTDAAIAQGQSADGRSFAVLREPFTDGKDHGRPLPCDASAWRREILGVPPAAEPPSAPDTET